MDPQILVALGGSFTLLVLAFFTGSAVERRHLADLLAREAALRDFPSTNFQRLPDDWVPVRSALVAGNVVVSVDYFKRFVAGLRGIFGGRIRSYEPLLDRARREAVLRMLEQAQGAGYDAVVNVRIETARTANANDGQQLVSGVEILAFGTALARERPA